MFERFLDALSVSGGAIPVAQFPRATVGALLDGAGGRTFGDGLYRVHTRASASASDALVRGAFPEFAGRPTCFGYGWLGRQFATDAGRGSADDPEVMMFEPGTGEALEIPVPFSRFHDEELVDYAEEALAREFFDQWLRSGGPSPTVSECVGYQRPLFLGGQDLVANLELSDLYVYWTLMGQLRRQAKGLPEGTSIVEVVTEQ